MPWPARISARPPGDSKTGEAARPEGRSSSRPRYWALSRLWSRLSTRAGKPLRSETTPAASDTVPAESPTQSVAQNTASWAWEYWGTLLS